MKKLTKTQQLEIIEGLVLLFENSDRSLKTAKKIIEDSYKIAHLNGTCKNEHLDWHKEGFQLIKDLKKMGITNIKK